MTPERQQALIVKADEDGLNRCAEALRQGEVIGMPTETVYGLAGDVFNESALARIFSVKERPTFDPLIVHVSWPFTPLARDALERLERLGLVASEKLSPQARDTLEALCARFWPGPLTLVLPRGPAVPDLCTSGLDTVAVRMPAHPVARALIERTGRPLAAPSANRFGRISPTQVVHVLDELGDRLRLVLDGGPCSVGVESTIVRLSTEGTMALLRPGGVPAEAIEALGLGPLERPRASSSRPDAPGMLLEHYAPSKTLTLLDRPFRELSAEAWTRLSGSATRPGLLFFSGKAEVLQKEWSERLPGDFFLAVLSPQGSVEEAARSLFAKMRELDHSLADRLFAEPCPEPNQGLGYALMDRLRRASYKMT